MKTGIARPEASSRRSRAVARALLASTVLLPGLAACGGGSSPAMTITPAPTPTPTPPTITSSTRFDGSSPPPPAGAVLALTQFAFKTPRASSATFDSAVTNAGASAKVVSWPSQFELMVPGLGLDATITNGSYAQIDSGHWLALNTLNTGGNPTPWQYMMFGEWQYLSTAPVKGAPYVPDNAGLFVTGASTLPSALPTTGTTTYVGLDPSTTAGSTGAYGTSLGQGEVILTANFATGAVTGSLNNLRSSGANPAFVNVGLNGSLSGSSLAGTTAVTFTTDPTVISTSATGRFTGGLYGPAFQELGLVWYAADSTNLVNGVAGAQAMGLGDRGFQNTPLHAITGTVFNPIQTAYQVSGLALSSDPADATAVLTVLDPGVRTQPGPGNSIATLYQAPSFRLDIPSLGVSATMTLSVSSGPLGISGRGQSGSTWAFLTGQEMNYAVFGAWATSASSSQQPLDHFGPFATGYPTPAAGLSLAPTATYSAASPAGFNGPVHAILSSPGSSASLLTTDRAGGSLNLTANFGQGVIFGSLTVPVVNPGTGASVGNFVVGLNGSITTNTFAGSTSVTSSTGSFMTTAATGTFKGGFFGPVVGNEVAGVFDVSDGTNKAVGSFGAPKASDRRLKRDIAPIGERADGLKLYRFRYIGEDEKLFTGVMAQDLLDDPRFAPAVVVRPSGLLMVDYDRLGLEVEAPAAMDQAGLRAVRAYEAVH